LFVCVKSPEVAIVVTLSGAPPEFVKVTLCDALVVPVARVANVSDAGLSITCEPRDIPDRLTICGLPGALSVIVRAATRTPPAVGVNVTLTLHAPPGASEPPHVLDSAKSPAFPPATAIFVMVSAAFPILVSMTDCDALVVPTAVEGNVIRAGDSCRKGPFTPVPVSGITCGLACVVSVRVSVPLLAPRAAGANVTLMVQFCPGKSLVMQLLL
jgi:hypothetical protein